MLTPEKILNILEDNCSYHIGDSVVVGVSGGADSVALLHLLYSAGVPVAVAHVNYGLRGEESDGDEEFVSALCNKMKIPLYVRRTNQSELDSISNNMQDAARIFRRNFYEEICKKESVTWIAVAHHADDQAETVLMNFMRGSGLRGLSGMRYVNGNIIRPLLDVSRNEIEKYLKANLLQWRDDSSNQSDDYLRNRVRHYVIPTMKEIDNRDGKGILHTINQCTESNELLFHLVKPWREKVSHYENGFTRIDKKSLDEFPVPHMLLNYLMDDEGLQDRFTAQSYLEFSESQPGKRFPGNANILNDRDEVIIIHGTNASTAPVRLFPGGNLSEWSCEIIAPRIPESFTGYEALLSHDLLKSELFVRKWEAGDRMQPIGFNGTKKVSDILTEMKIPNYLRENYPVVTIDDEIAWIPGYRIAEKFKVTEQTKTALHIKWNR